MPALRRLLVIAASRGVRQCTAVELKLSGAWDQRSCRQNARLPPLSGEWSSSSSSGSFQLAAIVSAAAATDASPVVAAWLPQALLLLLLPPSVATSPVQPLAQLATLQLMPLLTSLCGRWCS